MTSSAARRLPLALVVGGFVLVVQMIAIQRPYSGNFASYQATVMAAISRNMVRENFSGLLRPKTDVLLMENGRSLHMNQYPFPALLAAAGVKCFGGTFEFWGRFQAIVCNLLSVILLGLFAGRLFDGRTGWIAGCLYALSPFTLIYGQSFISEPFSLLFLLLAFLFLTPRGEKPLGLSSVLFAGLFFSIAVAGRIHFAVFYPLCGFFILRSRGIKPFLGIVIFTFFGFALPAAWYGYTYFVSMHEANVHTNAFVQFGLQSTRTVPFLIYLKRLAVIFAGVLLTPLLFPFFIYGWFAAPKGESYLKIAFGFFLGAAVLAVPWKIMAHDFYLYGAFPFIVILTACGVNALFSTMPFLKRPLVLFLLILVVAAISLRLSFNPIFKGLPEEVRAVKIGEVVQKKTNPEDRIIVASEHPAILLYYANRPVWNMDLTRVGMPLADYQKNARFLHFDSSEVARLEEAMKDPVSWLEYYRAKGAAYIVIPSRLELESREGLLRRLREHDTLISEGNDDFYLFKLAPVA